MADFRDSHPAGADNSPDDSLSDSAPDDGDDLNHQLSLGSDRESDRDGSGGLPPGKFTADAVGEVCTNASGSRCHRRKDSSMDGSLRKRVRQERSQSSVSDQLPYEEQVKGALMEITSLLNTVVKRVEKVESELKRQKCTSTDPSSSSDVTPTRAKPPLAVKSEVRRVYRDLLESDDRDFTGFDFGSGVAFNSPANASVVTRLVKEVQTLNPRYQAHTIKAAVYTYYRSLSQENRLKLSGKHNDRKQARRRRERLLRKLQERRSTLTKSSMSQKEKVKWGKVLVPEMMSSEESDMENDDVITVKPIDWRAERVRAFLHRLDSKITTAKSAQSKRQRKQRVDSSERSNRIRPATLPDWAVVNN